MQAKRRALLMVRKAIVIQKYCRGYLQRRLVLWLRQPTDWGAHRPLSRVEEDAGDVAQVRRDTLHKFPTQT